MNEEYAIQIARDWNLRASGAGYVTMFSVDADFASKYPIPNVGGEIYNELWVPAEELTDFNHHIIGLIEVTRTYI